MSHVGATHAPATHACAPMRAFCRPSGLAAWRPLLAAALSGLLAALAPALWQWLNQD